MSIIARQSTAITVTVGPVLDADGAIVTDAAVGDFLIAKNGTQGALNGSATLVHQHAGKYALTLTTADTGTVGTLEVSMNDAPNECPVKELQVIEEAVYDALYAASATGPLTTLGSNAPAGWINEAAFANNAITDAKVAADVTIASVTGNVGGIAGTITTLDALDTAQDSQHSTTQGLITTVAGYLDTEVAAILEDTGTTIPATLSTIAGYIDTEVAAIKAKTDNLPASPAATGDIPSAAIIAGAVLDETMSGHTTDGTLGKAVADILEDTAVIGAAGAGLTEAGGTGDQFTGIASVGSVAGTVGGVAGTTQTLDALATLIRGADGDTLKTLSDQIDSIPTTIRVKKNAALAGFPIVMLDTSGDPATSKTVTGTVSIDGAAFTSLTNAISEVSGGLYKVDLAEGDTNGNTLVMRFTATGCRTRFVEIVTQP